MSLCQESVNCLIWESAFELWGFLYMFKDNKSTGWIFITVWLHTHTLPRHFSQNNVKTNLASNDPFTKKIKTCFGIIFRKTNLCPLNQSKVETDIWIYTLFFKNQRWKQRSLGHFGGLWERTWTKNPTISFLCDWDKMYRFYIRLFDDHKQGKHHVNKALNWKDLHQHASRTIIHPFNFSSSVHCMHGHRL